MAIGEFGGVPPVAVATGPMYAAPAYWLYEMSQAALNPARALADAARLFFKNPANPLSYTVYGRTSVGGDGAVRTLHAALRQAGMGHHLYGDRGRTRSGSHLRGLGAAVLPATAFRARLRACAAPAAAAAAHRRADVGPLSDAAARHGRGFLPNHDVYVTEWVDARMVPVTEGRFDLDDYIDYLISMLHCLGGDTPRDRGLPAVGAGAGRGRAAWRPTTIPTCRIPWC